jgi:hypothetical protein
MRLRLTARLATRGRAAGAMVAVLAVALGGLVVVPATAAGAASAPSLGAAEVVPAAAGVAPAGAVERCDPTGDRNRGNDCIALRLAGRAKDGRIATQRAVVLDVRRHAALKGAVTALDVQLRRLHASGAAGRWHTVRQVQVGAGIAKARITPCFTHLAGRYEYRLRTRIASDAAMPARARAATTSATSAPAPVVVSQNPGLCVTSPDDAENVEFFNEMEFTENFTIAVAPAAGNAAAVTLQCPDDLTMVPTLQVQLMTRDGQSVQACQGSYVDATVAVDASDVFCTSRGACDVVVYAVNSQTGLIYSATELGLQLFTGGAAVAAQIVPELEAATVVVCDNTLNQCLTTGTCQESQNDVGTIQLCPSSNPADCAPPPAPSGSYIMTTQVR